MPALLWDFSVDGTEEMEAVLRQLGELAGGLDLVEDEIAALTDIPEMLAYTLDQATERNKDLAAYKRKTGDLEDTTGRGEVTVSGGLISCEWGARSEHASFVEAKGFSQTEAVADWAEQQLDDLFGGM